MKKKNLLFIFADQWRREAIGFLNKEPVITPNFDMFSTEAAIFEKAYSACPLCSPNRASILTGKFPISHGVTTNCKPGLDNVFLKENEITIGDILKKNGYRTGYIGKWHLDKPEKIDDSIPKSGAKNWDAYTPPGPRRHGFDFWYSYGADDNHLAPHYWMDSPNMIKVNRWSVEHETDIAIDFLEKNKDDSFALFLSWNPPHTPLDLIPQKYVDMYSDIEIKKRDNVILENIVDHPETMEPFSLNKEKYLESVKKYYGAITGIDEYFGKIIKYLKENNLFNDTIIVLTADHGEMLCSHGLWSKHVWFEESISVPFLISNGKKYENMVVKTPLTGADIMPTLLSILNIKYNNTLIDGIDLSPILESSKNIDNLAISGCYPGNFKVISNLIERDLNPLAYGWRSVSDEKYTYVYYKDYRGIKNGEEYLYDNVLDEYQLNPIPLTKNTAYLKDYLINWCEKFKDPILQNIKE